MRIATHERNRSSLIEIQTQWSIMDLYDMARTLNILDAAATSE